MPAPLQQQELGAGDQPRQLSIAARISNIGLSLLRNFNELSVAKRIQNIIVEGLSTGDADVDGDGSISAADLSTYVKRQLRKENAAQKPIEGGAYSGELIFGSNNFLYCGAPCKRREPLYKSDPSKNRTQTEALSAIFTGAAGGPMAAFAPLISENLGVKKVPITFRIEGKKRSAEIPGILHMSVDPLPTAHLSGEMWANTGHPISPDKLAFAVGEAGNTFSDHGMRWDNSGKNGHYAPISWSNQA
jgi:hypothetical protein